MPGPDKKSNTTMGDQQDLSKKYKKHTHREHILEIPDTYIGSIDHVTEDIYHCRKSKTDPDGGEAAPEPDNTHSLGLNSEMVSSPLEIVPGLYKIYDEILVNARDHVVRLFDKRISQRDMKINLVTMIRVNINQTTGQVTVYNDGDGIDVEKHPEHGVYIPSLVFGELLTSTNYDKSEKRVTGGKNGYGAKLTNIFSKKFVVETVDATRKRHFRQEYRDNLTVKDEPVVKSFKGKPFTKIEFIPDFERFGLTGWTDDMIHLMTRRAMDIAACTDKSVKVYLDDKELPVRHFQNYMDMYLGPPDVQFRLYEKVNDRWEIGVAISPDENFHQVSFVNGIYTSKGGKHVEYVVNQICKKVCEWIEKRKKITVKPTYVRENLSVFILSVIENPSFDSQTKETLTTTSANFGSKCVVTDKFIERLAKSDIIERIIELHEFKESKSLKKTDGRKTSSIRGIPKLDDANWAGTAKSKQCTLILTEGDSAKSMAVAGLSVVGRNEYGVFPLKGKIINVREKTATAKGREQVLNNTEINNLKKILGLQSDKEYSNTNVGDLRYGRIMVMTDQDVDGSHIKGLLFNVFASMWPTLLEVPGFMMSMLTPIIKATKGSQSLSFYSLTDYENWKTITTQKGWSIKYYKGLGTSTTKEAKEYFENLKTLEYKWEEGSSDAMDLAFNKHKADDRKDWLRQYDRDKVIDSSSTEATYEEFVDEDLIHFSVYDVERSIPNLNDGLKTSQRKILYSCFKRNLKREIRVAQLAGYVSENAAYHHGEESLNQAIIGMAQDYVGSNNFNLLSPNGQFGTRLQGGKDSASPRYIHTHLHPWTEGLFPTSDLPILDYLDDDGIPIEPGYYAPILPLVLMNGCQGIGTGFSTSIPSFNPLDVADIIKSKINQQPSETSRLLNILTPWYRGFTGKITSLNDERQQFITFGVYKLINYKTIEITELPIGSWTEDYKEFLETLLYEKPSAKPKTKSKAKSGQGAAGPPHKNYLKNFENHSTESKVVFRLEFLPEVLKKLLKGTRDKEGVSVFEKELRLTSKVSLTNMHLFNSQRVIQKYNTVSEIIDEFCETRLQTYQVRKDYQLQRLQYELDVLEEKIRFINGVVDENIQIHKRSRKEIDTRLEELEFRKFPHGQFDLDQWFKQASGQPLEADQKPINADYTYLVQMPIYNLTSDKILELEGVLQEKRDQLSAISLLTPAQMWSKELTVFLEIYEKEMKAWTKDLETEFKKKATGKSGKRKKVIKKKI